MLVCGGIVNLPKIAEHPPTVVCDGRAAEGLRLEAGKRTEGKEHSRKRDNPKHTHTHSPPGSNTNIIPLSTIPCLLTPCSSFRLHKWSPPASRLLFLAPRSPKHLLYVASNAGFTSLTSDIWQTSHLLLSWQTCFHDARHEELKVITAGRATLLLSFMGHFMFACFLLSLFFTSLLWLYNQKGKWSKSFKKYEFYWKMKCETLWDSASSLYKGGKDGSTVAESLNLIALGWLRCFKNWLLRKKTARLIALFPRGVCFHANRL